MNAGARNAAISVLSFISLLVLQCRCGVVPITLQNLAEKAQTAEGVYRLGVQYFISRGELYALQITTKNTTLTRLAPVNRDNRLDSTTDADNNPFLVPETGSGLRPTPDLTEELSEAPESYVYTVHHHHAFIAVGQDVIELLLNTNTPNYHRINVGQTPLQLEARDFGGETYLFVLYETNSRGYVAAYRKYSNGNWGKQGQYDLLVYSPQWFNLTQMSNILFFSADDSHYSYKVTYVAVAVGHTIYFKEILDRFEFSIAAPEPCNQIVSIQFNEVKQTLFLVCTNITYYFSYLENQLYTSGLWNRTGLASFAQDGQIASIATNHSGGMTTVTIHGLNFEPSLDRDERVYEFQHFHHVASRSLIIRGEFITVSRTIHYYCYIEQFEYGIVCINVERALSNVRSEGIINDATMILPNTRSVLCPSTNDCPVMYSHKEVFVVQVQVCEQGTQCGSLAMIFNMSSLENIANLTDVSLNMLAYKADTPPTVVSPPFSRTLLQTTSTVQPLATHTTSPVSSSTSIVPQQTPLTDTTLPTNSGPDSVDLLETCQNDLLSTDTAYSQLLTVTIALCACFCTAMVITILILVALICCNRRGSKGND